MTGHRSVFLTLLPTSVSIAIGSTHTQKSHCNMQRGVGPAGVGREEPHIPAWDRIQNTDKYNN